MCHISIIHSDRQTMEAGLSNAPNQSPQPLNCHTLCTEHQLLHGPIQHVGGIDVRLDEFETKETFGSVTDYVMIINGEWCIYVIWDQWCVYDMGRLVYQRDIGLYHITRMFWRQ